jgi:hypothetical protein
MSMPKIKVLVAILKEASLDKTISHEGKISLIAKLLDDYPCLSNHQTLGVQEGNLGL